MSETTILIVGATGKQGGKAISTLLSSSTPNLKLRFLTRNDSSPAAKKLISQGATPVIGNLNELSSIKEALKGVNRAFLVTDALAGEEKETQQGFQFVEAAKEAGLEHLVFSSVGAADIAKSVPHFRSKAKIEEALKASGLSYTILRPAAFMDNFPAEASIGRFLMVGIFFAATNQHKVQFIATEDIGVFAGKALLDPTSQTFKNQTINLGAGDYGLEDVRTAIQKAQGYVPWLASYVPKYIRMIFPYDFKMMMIYFEESGYPPVDVDQLKTIHPGLMSFEDYFRKYDSSAKKTN